MRYKTLVNLENYCTLREYSHSLLQMGGLIHNGVQGPTPLWERGSILPEYAITDLLIMWLTLKNKETYLFIMLSIKRKQISNKKIIIIVFVFIEKKVNIHIPFVLLGFFFFFLVGETHFYGRNQLFFLKEFFFLIFLC